METLETSIQEFREIRNRRSISAEQAIREGWRIVTEPFSEGEAEILRRTLLNYSAAGKAWLLVRERRSLCVAVRPASRLEQVKPGASSGTSLTRTLTAGN